MIVFLDTGVLGLVCNPNTSSVVTECKIWLERLLCRGVYIVTSEICDYEVRKGLTNVKHLQLFTEAQRWQDIKY